MLENLVTETEKKESPLYQCKKGPSQIYHKNTETICSVEENVKKKKKHLTQWATNMQLKTLFGYY